MDEIKVSEEMAQAEFTRILKAARVKWDLYRAVQGARDAESARMVIVDAIMEGRVVVDAEGFPTVRTSLESVPEIKVFRRGTRGDWLMVDRVKEGHNVQAQDSVMASFLKKTPAELQLLETQDYSLVESLWWIFLGYRS
jgi:hypothetical protein